MSWNNRIRHIHRWLSIAFTVGVVANVVAIFVLGGGEEPPAWVYLLALLPLFTLLPTGLYLFALPYAARWRSRQRA